MSDSERLSRMSVDASTSEHVSTSTHTLAIGVVLVLILAGAYYWYTYAGIIKSPAGWAVSSKYANHAQASELLERLNNKLMKFLAYLQAKFHIDESDDTILSEQAGLHAAGVSRAQRVYIEHLLTNYNYEAIVENDPAISDNTSLTIGKGKVLYMCLRRKDRPDELIDEHMLFFVLLHEISHIANYAHTGHGLEFWRVFKFILGEAKAAGVHEPADYARHPVTYCGLYVDYSPYWDPAVEPI